jgi:hypothetical protein
MIFKKPRNDALSHTDKIFDMSKKKEILQNEFK